MYTATAGRAPRDKLGLAAAMAPSQRLLLLIPTSTYRTEDFVARVTALTRGQGVDAAFDPMGAAHLRRSTAAVRRRGTVVGYGYYTAANRGSSVVLDVVSQYLWLALSTLPPSRKHVAFYDIRQLAKRHPDWFRQDLMTLLDLLSAGKLDPVIAERLPLDEVVRAHREVESAEVEGKVVLMPNP